MKGRQPAPETAERPDSYDCEGKATVRNILLDHEAVNTVNTRMLKGVHFLPPR